MKALILILCGLMLLSTQGNSMAHIGGPFGPKELKEDDPRNEHGIWITGGTAKDDGIHYTAPGNGLELSLGNKDPYWPSLDSDKAFSIAMTFKAGSLTSTDGNFELFSSLFRMDENPTADSPPGYNMNISYDRKTKTFRSNIKEDIVNPAGQLTGSFDGKDLTIVINQKGAIGATPGEQNQISITFYAGRTSLGTITYGEFSMKNTVIYDFTLGSNDTSLTLKGLGIVVNGTLGEDGLENYFDTIEAQSAPEPGTSILALWGGTIVLYRRRRAA